MRMDRVLFQDQTRNAVKLVVGASYQATLAVKLRIFNFFAAHSETRWPCTLTLAAEKNELLGTRIGRTEQSGSMVAQAAGSVGCGLRYAKLSVYPVGGLRVRPGCR
jgi:hypothetical protein